MRLGNYGLEMQKAVLLIIYSHMEKQFQSIKEKNMNKIIVWTNPTAPFQKIYVMKNNEIVDQLGVMPNNLEDIIYTLVDKYEITDIGFSGAHSFAERFMSELKKGQTIRYGCERLSIQFIKE